MTVNFFTLFPAYAPSQDPTWQSNRPANWDPFAIPSDSESDSGD